MSDVSRKRTYWFYGALAALPAAAALMLLIASPPGLDAVQRAALTFVVLGVMAGLLFGRGEFK